MDPMVFVLAAGATVPAAAGAWLMARALESRLPPRAGVPVWRAARLAAFAPVLALFAAPLLGRISLPGAGAVSQGGPGAAGFSDLALLQPVLAPVLDVTGAVQAAAPSWFVLALAGLYAAGLALSITGAVRRRSRLRRIEAASRPVQGELEAIAGRWRTTLGLGAAAAPLRTVERDLSPFVAGLRPVVYLPEVLRPGAQAEAAIAHELTHVRRGDERDRLIGEALTVLAWFNPCLRAVERRLSGARELACDADVLDRMPSGSRRGYASALADLAPHGLDFGRPAATAFLTDLASLRRRRVEAALGHRPQAGRARLAAALAGSLALGAGLPPAALAVLAAGGERESAARVTYQPAEAVQELSAEVGRQIQTVIELQDAEDWEGSLDVLAETEPVTAYERSVVLRLRATAHYQLDQFDEAIEAFEATLETGALTESEAQTLQVNIAQLEFATERVEAGARRIERLLDAGFEPNARLSQMFATGFVQIGEFENALPLAERALAMTEPDPGANLLFLTAFIYDELGMEAERQAMMARAETARAEEN
ncbi:MAG: M56 family metallopeptidase [Oceanicaulis sp.]